MKLNRILSFTLFFCLSPYSNSYTSLFFHSLTGTGLSSLEMIDLSNNALTMTLFNNTFKHVAQSLLVLWLGYNQLDDFQSSLFGLDHQNSVLTDLNLTSNSLLALSSENFVNLRSLRTLDVSSNKITSIEEDTFQDNSNLTQIWMNDNNLVTFSSGVFATTSNLEELYLHNNKIEIITSTMFSIPSLRVLNLFYNSIREIQVDAFRGLLFVDVLDLSHQSIEIIEEHAFRDTNISKLHLDGNDVRYVSPSSFPRRDTAAEYVEMTCKHIENWTIELVPGYFFTCDEFESLASHVQGFHLGSMGSAGLTPADACCGLGGGVRKGDALHMDSRSTVTCFSNASMLGESFVWCQCGASNLRYDMSRRTCISSCDNGEFWNPSTSYEMASFGILSSSGRCESCDLGLVGNSDLIEWPESCLSCDGGTFSSTLASTECRICDANTYDFYVSLSLSLPLFMYSFLHCSPGTLPWHPVNVRLVLVERFQTQEVIIAKHVHGNTLDRNDVKRWFWVSFSSSSLL